MGSIYASSCILRVLVGPTPPADSLILDFFICIFSSAVLGGELSLRILGLVWRIGCIIAWLF